MLPIKNKSLCWPLLSLKMMQAHLYGVRRRARTVESRISECVRTRRRAPFAFTFARTSLARPISVWRAERVDKQRTREKSTAVATRGAPSRTLAIAHTYLYTVIFKMKERRANGRAVVRTLPGARETA